MYISWCLNPSNQNFSLKNSHEKKILLISYKARMTLESKKEHFIPDFIEHKSDFAIFFYSITMKSLYNAGMAHNWYPSLVEFLHWIFILNTCFFEMWWIQNISISTNIFTIFFSQYTYGFTPHSFTPLCTSRHLNLVLGILLQS